jgi:hypothetical protein
MKLVMQLSTGGHPVEYAKAMNQPDEFGYPRVKVLAQVNVEFVFSITWYFRLAYGLAWL